MGIEDSFLRKNMKRFLFSVDLEEFYTEGDKVDPSCTSLESLVSVYLKFLEEVGGKCTFFVVGDLARKYPTLLKKIANAGHELGCHSDVHTPVDHLSPDEFRSDLVSNREAIFEATAQQAIGYRAPLMSVTKESEWVYDVLASLEFSYSSSVLPSANPLYGWKEFGESAKEVNGVWEIPVSLGGVGNFRVPFSCGTYFRLLPWLMLKHWYRRKDAVVGYFHPYDIDEGQKWCFQKELVGRHLMNHLLFVNRGSVMAKLNQVIAMGYSICTYSEFITLNESD